MGSLGDTCEMPRPKFTTSTYVLLSILVLLAIFPAFYPWPYLLFVVMKVFIFSCLMLSWNVLSGYAGYINFGHAAFYGTAAYIMGLSTLMLGFPIPLAIIFGGVVACLIGGAVGLVTLRLKGHYFAITTLMILFILTLVFTNISDFIPGARMEIWLPLLPYDALTFKRIFYYIFLGYFVILIFFSRWLENSKFGYGLKAIKEDEDMARGLGVNVNRLKNIACLISAFGAGIVGATYAIYVGYIDAPLYFSVALTFLVVFITIVGGAGTWVGPILGVALFVPVDEALTIYLYPEMSRIIYGVFFVAIILAMPGGLYRFLRERVRW